MRFLVDNALPPRLALLLCIAGHDAVHVRDCGMHAAADEVILRKAHDEERIRVSADTDFGAILAAQAASRPSFILFRERDPVRAEDYVKRLLLSLPVLEPELKRGCVAVFRAGRIRVRSLPFADS